MTTPHNVAKLVPKPEEKKEGVIIALKYMLDLAEKGELTGVAIAAVDNEGYTRTSFEPGLNMSTLLGAISRLEYRLLNHQDIQ